MEGLARLPGDRPGLILEAGGDVASDAKSPHNPPMPYAMLFELLPGLAEEETRTLTLSADSGFRLPPDTYVLAESFCDEPDCDCRRVMFQVFSDRKKTLEAVVGWGWESPAFYRRWLGRDDPETIRLLRGPALNPGSPRTENAPEILRLIRDRVLEDGAYADRVKRHYRAFRARLAERRRKTRAGGTGDRTEKVGRNAPCPCGSGRKHKHCCLPRAGR